MASAVAILGAIACFYLLGEIGPVGPVLMSWLVTGLALVLVASAVVNAIREAVGVSGTGVDQVVEYEDEF